MRFSGVLALALSLIPLLYASGDEVVVDLNIDTRTAFYEFIQEHQGKLPAPSEFLSEFANSKNRGHLLVIPSGRSIQKNKTNFKDPRFVIADNDGRIFAGFAPNAHQLEIISWNEALGQYDFLIV